MEPKASCILAEDSSYSPALHTIGFIGFLLASGCFLVFCFLKQHLCSPGLALNSRSSCFSLLSAEITDVPYYTLLYIILLSIQTFFN
jgi:hypothetical protein